MKSAFAFATAALMLIACSPVDGSRQQVGSGDEAAASAPPVNRAESLLTRYSWPGVGGGEKADWEPRDDCGELEGSYQFRMRLAEAVLARDEDALVGLTSSFVKLGFGGEAGHEDLKRQLRDEGLWDELEKVMELGCAPRSDAAFTMPWYFAQDMGNADPFTNYIVIGDEVPLLEEPSLQSAVVQTVGWALVVNVPDQEVKDGFMPVVTADGRKGFVEERALRSVVDYRIGAERQEEGWQLTLIAAGD